MIMLRGSGVVTAMMAGLLVLSACGGTADSDPASEATTGADADDLVVVALDDFAAMHALTLGVEPDLVLEAFGYASTQAVFADRGLETRPYGDALDLEEIAAADPDVVIGVSLPTTLEAESQLAQIATTTIIDYSATWDEQLESVASALGREEEATAVRDRLADQTEVLAGQLAEAGLAGSVASVVGDNGGFFSTPIDTAVGSVLEQIGLTRPPAQQAAGTPGNPFTTFTAETLTDQDGDVVFLLSGGAYLTESLQGSPLWPELQAVRAGAVHEVSGEVWLAASAFSISWILDDVSAVLLGQGSVGTAQEAPNRFAAFVGA